MLIHQKIIINGLKTITIYSIILFILSTNILADNSETPLFTGSYQNGAGNITIYIDDDSGASYWEAYIKTGANNWMYPGSEMSNAIYIKFVSSNYGSNMDFYSKTKTYWSASIRDRVLAETLHFDSSENQVQNHDKNWYYAKILINDDNFKKSSFSNENAQGTIIHEMGHAFGLAHNNTNPNSIMCQTSSGRKVQRVQYVDNNAINKKYK